MQKRTTIFRAASMLGGLSAVVVGATFAATPVTATLTNSALISATTALRVDGPDANLDFGQDDPGFTFNNLLPGSANWSAPQEFSLRNDGTTDLKVAVSTTGGVGTLDRTKVQVRVTNVDEAKTTTYVLDDLDEAKNLPGVSDTDVLSGDDPDTEATNESETNKFTVEVKLDEGAANQVTGLNFVFTGTPVDEAPVVTPPEEEGA